MGAITTLHVPPPVVAPGDEVTCQVTVRNNGTVVDSFTVLPLGTPAQWARVQPAEVALLPGEEAVVTVVFAPPRTWTTAPGGQPFGLRVVSREDPEGSVVEEGVLEVGWYAECGAELRPRTSHARGRWAGTHEIALDNLGNVPALMTLAPLDPDHLLRFELTQVEVEVAEGRTEIVRLKVRAQRRFWRGPAKNIPFQVHVEPAGAAPVILDGQLVQESAVPAWTLKSLGAALVVAAVLAGLWLTVLKPQIEDSAHAAAADTAAQAKKEAAATAAKQQKQIDDIAAKVVPPPLADASAKPSASASPSPSATPSTADALGDPISVRLAATATQQQPSAVLAKNSVVSITDLLLQNPAGDTGTLTLRRGTTTFYVARLENFRDLDLHLVAPMTFGLKDSLRLDVSCDTPGATAKACSPAVTVMGFARKATP